MKRKKAAFGRLLPGFWFVGVAVLVRCSRGYDDGMFLHTAWIIVEAFGGSGVPCKQGWLIGVPEGPMWYQDAGNDDIQPYLYIILRGSDSLLGSSWDVGWFIILSLHRTRTFWSSIPSSAGFCVLLAVGVSIDCKKARPDLLRDRRICD